MQTKGYGTLSHVFKLGEFEAASIGPTEFCEFFSVIYS